MSPWGRTLHYHPHVHYLVPGGALSGGEVPRWHPTSVGFFLPVRALSRLYRGKFRDAMRKAGLLEHIPAEVWTTAARLARRLRGEVMQLKHIVSLRA